MSETITWRVITYVQDCYPLATSYVRADNLTDLIYDALNGANISDLKNLFEACRYDMNGCELMPLLDYSEEELSKMFEEGVFFAADHEDNVILIEPVKELKIHNINTKQIELVPL